MQKVYSRRNWENSPSTNTPLGENNLNAMDYAIDEIDNRVIALYGYQDRVAESEENAKTSENNAKQSELNAKQSELLAKEYKDKAFTYTPDGYEEMVDEVFGLDIKSSTKSPLLNTRNGGLRFNSIGGVSEQNGTPTPTNPVPVKNAFDRVEMIQGAFYSSNGTFSSGVTGYVSGKNKIPCASGDVVKIVTETICNINIFFYNESGYISFGYKNNTTEHSVTSPSGATYFTFSVGNNVDTTIDTVGKVTLTINEEVVVPIKTVGKNFLRNNVTTQTVSGVTFTCDNGVITTSGTSTNQIYLKLLQNNFNFPVGEYILSGCKSNVEGYQLVDYTYDSNGKYIRAFVDSGLTSTIIVTDNTVQHSIQIYIPANVTVNTTFYPMIRKADITDSTYEPYKESNAYIRLSDSLRGIGDVKDEIVKQNGVWGVLRRFAEVTFDGSENWFTSTTNTTDKYRNAITISDIKQSASNSAIDNLLSNCYTSISANSSYTCVEGITVSSTSANLMIFDSTYNTSDISLWKTYLASNPLTVVYELATPTFEELSTEDQIALNSLETFDGATSISFDSVVQPTFEVEYGESKVGAYTLKALNTSESNEIRYKELAVALLALES